MAFDIISYIKLEYKVQTTEWYEIC
jgi:hypothetical protein